MSIKQPNKDEKITIEHIETVPALYAPQTGESGSIDHEHDAAFEKKVIRNIDRRLLLILGALYSIALIDRNNLGVARELGMAKDLQLTIGSRYSIASLTFFVPYIIFELPSNILLRRIGARNLLGSIAILWGTVMIGMSFVTSWTQLVGLRIVLGFFESGLFSASVFMISTWYTRWETQKRIAFFYLISMCLAGFSSIMAYGLAQLPPSGVLHNWRYIFLAEGVITVGLGILAYFLVVDFPEKNTFLTSEETKWVIDRVNRDRGDGVTDTLTPKKALKYLLDWQTWCFGLCFMGATLPVYAFSYFLPVILKGAGYSTVLSLCLSAPPYLAAALYTFGMAYASDKFRQRGLFISINACSCIVGCLIIGYAIENRNIRYFGAFLAIMGGQANVPAVMAYSANNTVTHSKKAVASAVVIGMGAVGGIFASTVYRQQDYPRYLPGLWASIAAQVMIILLCCVLKFANKRINKALDEGRMEPINGVESFRFSI